MATKSFEFTPEEVNDGAFKRRQSSFRNWITVDGSSGFKAEKDRYHLYVSYACPWAHRTLIVRKLKGLEHIISVNVVDYFLERELSWSFETKNPGATGDTVNGFKYIKEAYYKANPDYSGAFTVPVLWDKKTQTIVNNESSEIIRMLNSQFNEWATNKELDLYPEHLVEKIESVNSWIYDYINDGVYKSGFAKTQAAYDKAVNGLFDHLEKVEEILKHNRYLTGGQFTLADVRLFTTLLRFDIVYYLHFKCNKKSLVSFPNLWEFTKEVYQMPGIAETCNFEHIKKHYFMSHVQINPFRVVPIGPIINFDEPHKRNEQVKH